MDGNKPAITIFAVMQCLRERRCYDKSKKSFPKWCEVMQLSGARRTSDCVPFKSFIMKFINCGSVCCIALSARERVADSRADSDSVGCKTKNFFERSLSRVKITKLTSQRLSALVALSRRICVHKNAMSVNGQYVLLLLSARECQKCKLCMKSSLLLNAA